MLTPIFWPSAFVARTFFLAYKQLPSSCVFTCLSVCICGEKEREEGRDGGREGEREREALSGISGKDINLL